MGRQTKARLANLVLMAFTIKPQQPGKHEIGEEQLDALLEKKNKTKQ